MRLPKVVQSFSLVFSLAIPVSLLHAELIYVDAIDGTYHSGSASPNTFNANTHSATDWVTDQGYGDGTQPVWGYRGYPTDVDGGGVVFGPGVHAYGASAYQGKISQPDPPLYTKVGGLSPGTSYGGLRLYFIDNASSEWQIQYSLDGSTWSGPIWAASSGCVKLVTSTNDALGTPTTSGTGDRRYYYPIPGTLTADAGGEIRLYVRTVGSSDRFRTVYDGFAYDNGITPPPMLATDPQPPDEANFFGADSVLSLSWSNPPTGGTISCDVYFGDQDDYDPADTNHFGLPLIHAGVPGTSVPSPGLMEGNAYYWMVDCLDSGQGLLPGELWSFEILPPASATGVIISEFMAANDETLTNSLGGTDDWIELYNNSASTIDLGGWFLTDSTNQLVKWAIPSVPSTVLAPDSYLIIWASGLGTATNGELHAPFRLSAGGEYLALVRPDGVTVEQEYAPTFPEQLDDISYGVDLVAYGDDVVALPLQVGCRYWVPANDIGTSWHGLAFDDSAWSGGTTGIGYEVSDTSYLEDINTDVEAEMYNQRSSLYVRIPFVISDPSAYSSLRLSLRFDDGFVAFINGVEVARSNAPVTVDWDAPAETERDVNDALVLAPFTISHAPSTLLVTGTNVLAIHGLNSSAASPNFLIQPKLEGKLVGGYTLQQERYYAVPTPGAPNSDAFLGLVGDTKFSVDRGFYDGPISVTITCETSGAAIRYTLDGSTPTEVHGTLYSGPISVTTTTTLRALAYRAGFKPSNVDTHTYLFVEDVMQQPVLPQGWPSQWWGNLVNEVTWSDYEMDPDIVDDPQYTDAVRSALTNIPTLSLVTDLPNLFAPDTGIYVNTYNSESFQGPTWERPVSAEWIHPDGRKGFQVNCGLRLQGGGSRGATSTPKHSFRLLFKGVYGPTKLKYRMFDDSTVDSFDTLHLRAVYNNSWLHWTGDQRPYCQENQDQFARDIQLAMGQQSIHGNLCHLYINGVYWGLYHPGERPDESWASSYFGGPKEQWESLNAGDPGPDGDTFAWDAMFNIANAGLSSPTAYSNFLQYCDVTSLIDYLIIMHYIDNGDWDSKNNYAVRRRQPGETFKFICWDSERGLDADNTFVAMSKNTDKRPSRLFEKARVNPEFRLLFADRLHRHLFNDGALTPSRAAAIWRQRSDVIDSVIASESARWGDFRMDHPRGSEPAASSIYTPNEHYFPRQQTLLTSYFPTRTANLLARYGSPAYDLYPTLPAPEFGRHGGLFTNTMDVTLSGPPSVPVYYTLDGTDPREFGTGHILGALYTGPIPISHSTRVKARCYDSGNDEWSALLEADFFDVSPSPLRISEVMYAPRIPDVSEATVSDSSQAYAFVEIHNTDLTHSVGLVGVSVGDGLRFDFSNGPNLTLPAGGFMVIVEDPTAFGARYPWVTADKIAGEYRGDLTFSGDAIDLLVEGLGPVVLFEYGDGRGWPLAADQSGHSLIPLVMEDQSSGQLDYGGNWKASARVDGSPGAPEPTPLAALALNEVIAHTDFSDPAYPDYDSNDKIEIINYGSSNVSLSGFYLSDDASFLKKWAMPAGGSVAAGEIVVFDEITGFHSPLTHGFGLDKAGEQVLLSYASGSDPASVVDAVVFKAQENGRSWGRYPDALGYWRACLPTPGFLNALAVQEAVISEIMYHPTSNIPAVDNTADEFVEILNPTVQPLSLWSSEGGTNIGSWRLSGEIDYVFPPGTVLDPGANLLVVSFDPVHTDDRVAFLAAYGLSEPQRLFGPFSGKLSNQGGRVALEKPLGPDLPGEGIAWIIVDEVFYADEIPWPASADGFGDSLHRTVVNAAGADPDAWVSGAASPGRVEAGQPDLLLSIRVVGGLPVLGFNLLPESTYTIEVRTNILTDVWTPYTNVAYPQTEQTISLPANGRAILLRLRRD